MPKRAIFFWGKVYCPKVFPLHPQPQITSIKSINYNNINCNIKKTSQQKRQKLAKSEHSGNRHSQVPHLWHLGTCASPDGDQNLKILVGISQKFKYFPNCLSDEKFKYFPNCLSDEKL